MLLLEWTVEETFEDTFSSVEMLFRFTLLGLLPLLGLCDVFMRDNCWCRNTTHLGWTRHYQLNSRNIEGGPSIFDEWCFEATNDGKGKCMDQHTKQYEICASHPAIHNSTRRNDFCYYNHGNNRGKVPHWSQGDDRIYSHHVGRWMSLHTILVYNSHKRDIPRKPSLRTTTEESMTYCEPICKNYRHWNLPVMLPFSPSKHGVVGSLHDLYIDIEDLPFEDGAGGEWPVKVPVHEYPGGYSTTGAGIIDFWEIEEIPWRSEEFEADC
ncbi:MAG: hypothetical protein Q9170_001886 [Blastenia crenularia]